MQLVKEVDNNLRCYPESSNKRVLADHLARYEFFSTFVKDQKVLDIACGEGYGSNLLKLAGAQQVYGADVDAEIIEQAKSKYGGVFFAKEEASATSYPDNYFDIIISFETWHYLKDYNKFIIEVNRILKSDGQFIFSVPNSKVIYFLPFGRKKLTKYYQKNFTKQILTEYLQPYFAVENWYGQRFVKLFYLNPLVKTIVYLVFSLTKRGKEKINQIYKLADGPQVKGLSNDNSRYIIGVCKKIK